VQLGGRAAKGEGARGREEEEEEGERKRKVGAHLRAQPSPQPSTRSHLGQRRWKRGGRERERRLLRGKQNEIEREWGAHGSVGHQGRAGRGRARLGWAGPG
jgi:hypothetical protein